MGDAMKITEWTSMSELAKMIGVPINRINIRKLRKRLMAIEAIKGVRLVWQINQGNGQGVRYGVTLAQLEQHAPEMFNKTNERIDAIAAEIRARMSEIHDKLDEHDDRIEAIRMLFKNNMPKSHQKGAA
jgi:tetrahydromethanopterin S-methyltransferase subunit G